MTTSPFPESENETDTTRRAGFWRAISGALSDMAAAWRLLSILPLPERWMTTAQWPRAARMIPVAGALLGLAMGALFLLLLTMLHRMPEAAALLTLLAGLVLTGALHEDGLADLADALGGDSRRRRLEIMRDAQIGTFGVLALLITLALQAVALVALAEKGAAAVLAGLTLAHGGSRLAAVWLLHRLPPAREDGMSSGMGRPDERAMAQAGLSIALLMLAAWPWLGGTAMAAAFITANLLALGMMTLARRLLGGQTGDAAGATEMAARTGLLLALAS